MKKITLFLILLFSSWQIQAQLYQVPTCLGTIGSNLYGPMNSIVTAGANNRTAVIYPSSQLTGIAGQILNGIYFKRIAATGTLAGTPNFKVYLKETSLTDFGAAAIDWSTEIASATLVYDSNPAASIGTSAGWKGFSFASNFTYSGTQNLAVYMEYINPIATTPAITWEYEYQGPCISTTNSNTTKYNNNTTNVLSATLASTNYRRPFIGFDFVVSCNAPSNLVASNLTENGVTVSWTENTTQPQNGYEYYYTTTTTPPTPASTPNGATATGIATTNLSGLNSGTTYNFWVRGNCGTSDKSIWQGPISFTTVCTSVNTFFENFDSNPSTGTTSPMPNCWERAGTTGSTYVTTGGANPGSAPNRLLMTSSGTTPTVAYATMPIVSNIDNNTNRLRFKGYASVANRTMDVGYLATPGDQNTFVNIQTITFTNTTAATAQEFYVTPNALSAGTTNLCFKLANTTSGQTSTVYLDDVAWEVAPTAIPDCAASVATPNSTCGFYPTTISWPAVPGADGYLFSIGTNTNGNDIVSNQSLGNVLSFSYVGTAGTIYNYKITPFNTLGNAQGCPVLSFTTSPNASCYCLPSSTSDQSFINNFTTAGGSTNISNLASGFSTGGFQDATSQSVSAYATSAFTFNAQIVGGTVGFAMWIDWDNSLTFEPAEKVFNTTAYGNGPFTGTITVPAGTALGDYRMRITTDFGQSNPNLPCDLRPRAEFEDYTVTVVAPPACAPPSNLNVSLITATGATLGWTDINNSTAWNVEYDITGFTQGTGTVVNNVTNPYAASGLMQNTTYQFYVQSVCTSGTSTWSGPFSFTTACSSTSIPYTQDFESAIVPALPNCTSAVNNGTGNIWSVFANTTNGFTTKTLRYVYNTANPADTWFFTQGVDLVAGTSYRIAYNYGNNSTLYVEKLKVAYGNSASSASMTNVLFDHTSVTGGTIQLNQVDFIPTTSGVYYFGFQANSIANQFYLYVDNISVDVTPACSAPINVVASNVVSTSATINWATVNSAVTYEYVNDTTMADPTVPGTTISSTTVSFTNLLPLTQYYFHVRSNCAGTDSAWSTITYTTPATPPANDLCANAQVLNPGGTFATNPLVVTNVGATNSLETAPGCASYAGGDLFYTVVVPASGSITIETNPTTGSTITDTGLAVYSGACGALVLVECDDDDSASGLFSLVSLTGRTPGEILTIRVWEFGNNAFGDFQVSAYDSSLGSNTFDNSAFSFYPNPVKDFLNLNYSESIQKIQVLNLIGQQVQNQSLNATSGKVDMSNLPSGAYIVKISTDLGEKTIKVIKE